MMVLLTSASVAVLAGVGAGLFFLNPSVSLPGADTPPAELLTKARAEHTRYKARLRQKRYLTMVDYSRSILQTRLWVYDLAGDSVLLAGPVSHALRSGLVHATQFSNVPGSRKSSLGSYLTQESYQGRFGYSMRLTGLDSRNSNARQRAIVFHTDPGCRYSDGCFMTDADFNRRIIDAIKGGGLVYVGK